MKTSGPADSKSVPGFDDWPIFVGVIEQNKISDSYENYCILHFVITFGVVTTNKHILIYVLYHETHNQ